jgi:hypothetical protein
MFFYNQLDRSHFKLRIYTAFYGYLSRFLKLTFINMYFYFYDFVNTNSSLMNIYNYFQSELQDIQFVVSKLYSKHSYHTHTLDLSIAFISIHLYIIINSIIFGCFSSIYRANDRINIVLLPPS